jgi:hypothetical protein
MIITFFPAFQVKSIDPQEMDKVLLELKANKGIVVIPEEAVDDLCRFFTEGLGIDLPEGEEAFSIMMYRLPETGEIAITAWLFESDGTNLSFKQLVLSENIYDDEDDEEDL